MGLWGEVKQERGVRISGTGSAIFYRADIEELSGNVTFEKRPKGNKGVSSGEIWGRTAKQRRPNIQGAQDAQCGWRNKQDGE